MNLKPVYDSFVREGSLGPKYLFGKFRSFLQFFGSIQLMETLSQCDISLSSFQVGENTFLLTVLLRVKYAILICIV